MTAADEAIKEVVDAWGEYAHASTPEHVHQAYNRISNAISDLKTWHTKFNRDKGEIYDQVCPNCNAPVPEARIHWHSVKGVLGSGKWMCRPAVKELSFPESWRAGPLRLEGE